MSATAPARVIHGVRQLYAKALRNVDVTVCQETEWETVRPGVRECTPSGPGYVLVDIDHDQPLTAAEARELAAALVIAAAAIERAALAGRSG